MHTWTWQQWQGLPYLTCSLLEPFAHGFFTRHCTPRLPAELIDSLDLNAQPFRLRQVHGNTVLAPSEIPHLEEPETELAPGDGLVTEATQQGVWVCSADCVPALIADIETGQVAAVHAGWRGTAAAIVPRAIARLQQQGSQLENLRVALGPAINGSVYQVTTAVAAEVGASVVPVAATSSVTGRSPQAVEEVLTALHSLPNSPLLPDSQPGRIRLDVRQVNVLQLERLGIGAEQVAIAPYCTYQTPEHFFSYRRNPEKKVQWSGIVSR
ncbi:MULTISPECIES: peptidoglycan editing factor PgeF [unclassified Leptolyngbya]|uniref:peptidoglycan editing factor PgeF n=1 Tax=unclassified Leptolyngbya TaxID=2650499 RepID=UPI0016844299|nr:MULTISPECIES: peptidoglycan editing factor PgeF [unclassified Leptolyngbya]MBD1912209.1 peptidoglycan editing factor PgeF [Leptolyngbya sp. FACHB-8]MBD2155100.1 peptidoglycan editing factor PgeF [Leptolyngbya sp. FACHB-16]